MKNIRLNPLLLVGGWLVLYGCAGSKSSMSVRVKNPAFVSREQELVEIPLASFKGMHAERGDEGWIVLDRNGRQIPSQVTHDSLLLFPVTLSPLASDTYRIERGKPDKYEMVACGNVYPNRLDDVAWENDKAGYRAYGPALQRTGEKAYGYDVFTKSVAYPVLERRYQMETSSEILSRISELRKQGKKNEADSLRNATSYHVDHGNGMDCYNVGPTLGGGTAALLHGTDIIFPYCYQHVEILDNGPLRFCMRLRYHPFSLAADSGVVETRKITLDAGSHLNKTEVIYNRLSKPTDIVAGIVLHPQNPDGYFYNTEKGILVYADSTNNKRNNNGVIYVGLVFGQYPDSTGVRWFDDAEKKKRPGALGHVLGYGTYYPGTAYTYYWGSGWSKSNMRDMNAWKNYLQEYAEKIKHPVLVEVDRK